MARVELSSLSKRYPNGFQAVQGVDIDIDSGEFIVLVGPSGCGKSTTLRMVAGLESISAGELRIGGRRVNETPPKDRGVAMVFQSYALYPHMTVFQNMAFGLTLQKLPKAEIKQRVEAVAERLDITDLLPRKPKQMSGGQRQRVAMGRAIVRRPKVFLFDEPLSNLDASLRLKMRVELGRLHQSLDATSLYVTHDQVEAMTLADRIVLLKDGVVQQIGAPLALYDRPANLFTATFLGSPAMNILPGTIDDGAVCGAGFHLPLNTLPLGTLPQSDQGAATGTAVKLGIRPHDLRFARDGIPAEVEIVEPMGSETFVHCRLADDSMIVVRIEGHGPQAGEPVHLALDPEAVHVFNAQTEQRL
jgi:multiple sugar transport system ATP-binding protein